jgi:hypothetical protein
VSATPSELLLHADVPQLRAADALPELVLRPVPVSEPPYDDELPDRTRPHLSLVPTLPAPVGPLAHLPALRLVAPPAPPVLPAAPSAPAVRPVARALVQGLLEVLGGVRPVSQLRRRTSPALCTDLEALVHASPRPVGTRPSTGAVLSLHVQQPSATVAEVCATVRRGGRAGALALRLELEAGAWVCTALAGLGPQDLPTQRPEPGDEDE